MKYQHTLMKGCYYKDEKNNDRNPPGEKNYELRITNYELRITNYELRITNYELERRP
jgi:hypothetical protein